MHRCHAYKSANFHYHILQYRTVLKENIEGQEEGEIVMNLSSQSIIHVLLIQK